VTAVSALATGFMSWRESARALLEAQVPPEAVSWQEEANPSLFDEPAVTPPAAKGRVAIPRALASLLEAAACHADPHRWALMYRLLWRVVRGERGLLGDPADPDVLRVRGMARAVEHEVHRMHAFVRFRERATPEGTLYEAWFEPEHDVLKRSAPFFVDRFASMHWIIATPRGAAAWNGSELSFIDTPPARPQCDEDAGESLWRTYYASIFNPARANPSLMRSHMPRRYWRNLPEAQEIARLARVAAPMQAPAPAPRWSGHVHVALSALDDLQSCRRCPLWESATQAVPARGPRPATLMLVGEQPGDEEDLRGEPFIGPAGEVLSRALAAAGIARDEVYLTNAVKHFKWEPRGKRRLHKTPAQREIEACMAWLERDVHDASPRVIVALGGTALFALLGERVGVAAARGRELRHASGVPVIATYHPSAVLRARENGEQVLEALRDDLARARRLGGE